MAAEKAPVDPAVFGAVQLIYLARPSFGHGLHDPVPRRSGIWQGEADTVAVPELLPEPDAATYESDAAAFGPAEGLEELCDALRARLAGELHVREHLLQAARAYVRQHGPNIDQAALVAALEAVACEHRSRAEVAGYGVDRLVDHVVRQGARRNLDAVRPAATPRAAGSLFRRGRLQPARRAAKAEEFPARMDQPPARLRPGAARDRRATGRRVRRRRAGLMAPLDFNAPTPEEKAEIRRRKGAITRRIKREVLAKYGLHALPKQGERVLVTGGQGTGKSRTTAEQIAELRGDTAIWWLVPTLAKAEEQVAEYTERAGAGSMKARVVRGRGAPDPRTGNADAMCPAP